MTRPVKYAHEEWAKISPIIKTLKEHKRNRYRRLHKGSSGPRVIVLTRPEASLYDDLEGFKENNVIDYDKININIDIKILLKLTIKNIFIIKDGFIYYI
jgi:hypothetical protein